MTPPTTAMVPANHWLLAMNPPIDATTLASGARIVVTLSPMAIAAALNDSRARAVANAASDDMSSNALPVWPADSCTIAFFSVHACMSFDVRMSAPPMPRTFGISPPMISAEPPAASLRIRRTPSNPSALIAASPLEYPASASTAESSSDGFSNDMMRPRSCVPASAVLRPCAVSVASAEPTSSMDTPAEFAIGAT